MNYIQRYSPVHRFGTRYPVPGTFHDFFNCLWKGNDVNGGEISWPPRTDVIDKDDKIVITADLPGVKKDDVTIDLENNVLIIKGKRSSANETQENGYYLKERHYGSFERRFALPRDIKAESIDAGYKDGVLNIEIPKSDIDKPKKISVH